MKMMMKCERRAIQIRNKRKELMLSLSQKLKVVMKNAMARILKARRMTTKRQVSNTVSMM